MRYKRYSKYIKEIFETPPNSGSWFGYYNYNPISSDGTKMLSNRAHIDAVNIDKGMTIDLGFYDLRSGEWHKIGESDSFNWPQGSMLQWVPSGTNKNRVIYNTSRDGHNIARIIDIDSGESRDIDWCIYGITPDGLKSIALDMERQHWCRGYHYESVANPNADGRIMEGDGIFEIDLVNNKRRILIDIKDIIAIDKEEYFDVAKHWLEHIMISPDGKRFCFLHRFTIDNIMNYETRLFVVDIDGSNLQVIDGWKNIDRSHFGWCKDNAFAIYGYESLKHVIIRTRANNRDINSKKEIKNQPTQTSLLKKVINFTKRLIPNFLVDEIRYSIKGQHSYYEFFTLLDGKFNKSDQFCQKEFRIDGHPSFTEDGLYMITDTYPDSNQYQHLIIFNLLTKKAIVIARLYAGLHGKPGSCDLHPKLCSDNRYIVVDTAYDGNHHMIMFEILWDKVKSVIG